MRLFCKLILSTLLLLALLACATKTNVEAQNNSNSSDIATKQLLKEGYKLGKVTINEGTSCPFIIEIKDSNLKMDPINFTDTKFKDFRENELVVFIKYRLIRMANRCHEAQPIEIEAIKKGS